MDSKKKDAYKVNQNYQLDLWADRPGRQAAGHADALHGESEGTAFLLQKKTDGRMKTIEARPGRELPAWIREYGSILKTDCYISQNSFRGDRRTVGCIDRIGAIWSDIDYYTKPRYEDVAPEKVYDELQIDLDRAGIPQPSLAIYSGRGLYAVWLLEKGYDLSDYDQWKRTQQGLCDQLREYGADPAATDGARILRLCSTENSKTGHRVKCFDGTGRLHVLKNFTTVAMEQATDQRQTGGAIGRAVWSRRVNDLMKLPGLLGGHMPEGRRHNWTVVTATGLAWLDTGRYHRRERRALLDYCPGYTMAELDASLGTLDRRAGEAIGQNRGLYRFKNETIREWLGLSVQFCRENRLYSLIGKNWLHGEANTTYKQYKRRKDGMQTRTTYIEQATNTAQRERIIELAGKGYSERRIAFILSISRARVWQILQGCPG